MKKILHVSEAFEGGVLNSVLQICTLTIEDFESHVYYRPRPNTPDDFVKDFPDAVQFDVWDSWERSFRMVRSAAALFRKIREIEPDIVHLHSSYAGGIGRLIRVLIPRVAFVYSPRCYAFKREDLSVYIRFVCFLIEITLGYISSTITVACGYDELRTVKKISRRSSCIPNAVESSLLLKDKKKISLGEGISIICVGRNSPQKNFPLFVEIAREMQFYKDISFLWIGFGVPLPSHALPSNVTLVKWAKRTSVVAALAEADVYLHVAKWEGLSRAMLEAGGMALPIVSSDVDGAAELIGNNEGGVICQSKAEFCEAISTLRKHREIRSRMSKNILHVIRTSYSEERVKCQWLNFYQQLLIGENDDL